MNTLSVPKTPLILASTSVYRKAQLSQLGCEFQTAKPICDEDAVKAQIKDPLRLATTLAKMKAESLALDDNCVIGGDQVGSLGELILGKPKTFEKACEQLEKMSGQFHQLITAVCVIHKKNLYPIIDITTLEMRKLSSQEIEEYVRRDEPLDCAGSYKIEKSGIALFNKIETEDFTAIQGLPLMKLAKVLRTVGIL